MPHIEVVEGTQQMRGRKIRAFALRSRHWKLIYLPRGMRSGLPSVGLAVLCDDGESWFLSETSLEAWITSTAALVAFTNRRGDKIDVDPTAQPYRVEVLEGDGALSGARLYGTSMGNTHWRLILLGRPDNRPGVMVGCGIQTDQRDWFVSETTAWEWMTATEGLLSIAARRGECQQNAESVGPHVRRLLGATSH